MKRYFTLMLYILCISILCIPMLCIGCAGCDLSGDEGQSSETKNSLLIMTWNVQNLFDGKDDGTEYAEFTQAEGWSVEKYKGRLNVISAAIGGLEQKPDIIAMQEVESIQVMNDLAAALSGNGYNWTQFASVRAMALGVGLISRYPITGTKSHSVYVDGEIAPRPMLEAGIVTSGNSDDEPSLMIFVCHWKSKIGGEDATESTRRASARIILRRLRELKASEKSLPVIVTGDLNENYDEFYRRSGEIICALLPDDPRAAQLVNLYGIDDSEPDELVMELQQDFIIISRQKPPAARFFPTASLVMYSPWADDLENNFEGDAGTYYYRNNWETIDHFLLCSDLFNGIGWDYDRSQVLNVQPFASVRGYPLAYNIRTGSGISDHLPLLLFLKYR